MNSKQAYVACDTDQSLMMGLEKDLRGKINMLQWDSNNKSQMFVASNDGLLSYLNHKGERFRFRAIDVGEVFDRQQGLYRALQIQRIKIKALTIDHYRDELLLCDNKGQLLIYSLPDVKFKRSYTLTQSLGVISLAFSPANRYLGVVFRSGLTMILDRECNFKPAVKLEEGIKDPNRRLALGIKLFQSEFELAKWVDSKYYIGKQDKNFHSLTVFNPSSIRQHQLVSNGTSVSALATTIFSVDGIITGFDLHPSKEYVMILSSVGYVGIYQLQTSQCKAKIRVPQHSSMLVVDPSGLYFAIGCVPTMREQSKTKGGEQYERKTRPVYLNPNTIQADKPVYPCDLRIYESGTGESCQEIKSVFVMTAISFSADGLYVVCGGKGGKVSVWGLPEDMACSISDVLDSMKLNPFFWKDYPIDIEQEKAMEDTLDLSDIPAFKATTSVRVKSKEQPARFKPVVDPKINVEILEQNFKVTESRFTQQQLDVKNPMKTEATPRSPAPDPEEPAEKQEQLPSQAEL